MKYQTPLVQARRVVIAATLGVVLVAGMAAASSCGSKRDGFDVDADASQAPPSASYDGPTPPPWPACQDATVPFVACTLDAAAPTEAGTADGGAASPCDRPPAPRCVCYQAIAQYGPGPCDAGRCAFSVNVLSCVDCEPTGDAGDHYCGRPPGK